MPIRKWKGRIMITYKIYDKLPEEAKQIRIDVFMTEQGFKEEFDAIDEKARYIVVFVDGTACGTARFYPLDATCYQIGRIAVLKEYRQQKIGSFMLNEVFKLLQAEGVKNIRVGAQMRALNFYLSLGFKETKETYYDENVLHIYLEKSI